MKINNMQVNQAEGMDREWFARRFSPSCEKMGTNAIISPHRLSIAVAPETGPEVAERCSH